MINERRKIIPEEENTFEAEDWVGKRFSEREKCLGRWRIKNYWERSEKMREKNVLRLYIEKHESRWIERCREVSSTNSRQMELSRCYWEVSTAKWPQWIEKLSSIYWAYRNFLDRSRSCWEAIQKNSQKLQWIKIAITAVEKGGSRGSINSLSIKKLLRCSKNSFSKKRKTQRWIKSSILNQRSK